MVQTAEAGERGDVPAASVKLGRCAFGRCLLRESEVRPVVVVVADVFGHEALEVTLVEDDDMIKQVSAAAADEALGYAILPGAAEACPLWLDAKALDGGDDLGTEIAPTVEDQVLRVSVIRERIAQLLRHPGARRVPGDAEVQDSPPVMGYHKETVDHPKRKRRHREEVHRGDCFAVVAEKSSPSICRLRVSWRLSHPAQNTAFGDVEAKHRELTVNPRCSPGLILGYHAKDEVAQVFAHTLSAGHFSVAGEPCPIRLETRPMPTKDGVGPNDDQSPFPARPKPLKNHPKESIR